MTSVVTSTIRYSYTGPPYKLLVIRVCTGIVLAFTLHRLVRTVREQLEQQPSPPQPVNLLDTST